METAIGACLAGTRSLVAMKHVGLNVAADPFMTLSLTGVNAGLVVVSADDPGMHSSQNEQDNRHYAPFAKVPLLEPADGQEAYEFVAQAAQMSRSSTRRCCCAPPPASPTAVAALCRARRSRCAAREWDRNIPKYVMVPQFARERNRLVLRRLGKLRSFADQSPLNVLEAGTTDFGIISSGVAYQYAREAFPKAWFLKLGMSWPLPVQKIAQLYRAVSRVAVVEELDPFLEEQVRALGLPIIGKQALPSNGELDQEIVFAALEPYLGASRSGGRRRPVPPPEPVMAPEPKPEAGLPLRPPVLCPGCSHRSVFAVLKKHKVTAFGDIGCYTLGALPPLLALDSCLCMGVVHRHDGGHEQSAGPQGIGRGAWRLHLLPFRCHTAHRRTLQRLQRSGAGARQSYHCHDRPPGASGHRPARRRLAGAGAGCAAALRWHRRALHHRGRARRRRLARGRWSASWTHRAWGCWWRRHRAPSRRADPGTR